MTRFSKTFVAAVLAATFVSVASAETLARSKAKSATPEPATESKAEHVEFVHEGRQRSADGRVVIEAADGGILLEAADGVLWAIERGELQRREKLDEPFKPLTPAALSEKLLAELPAGFRVTPRRTTSSATTRRERTPSGPARCWSGSTKRSPTIGKGKGLELREPEFPLPVFVFADRQQYDEASREDLPGGTGNIVGFYSLRSNRVNMFDLTGVEAVRAAKQPRLDARDQPDALAAGRRAARGHDRSRSHAPNRLQLRPATALRRYPAVAVRRHGRVLRSARPRQHARLARHRPRELPAAGNVPQKSRRTGTTARSKNCSATAAASATRERPSTPTPTPGHSTTI